MFFVIDVSFSKKKYVLIQQLILDLKIEIFTQINNLNQFKFIQIDKRKISNQNKTTHQQKIMKKRINFEILKKCQQQVQSKHYLQTNINNIQQQLYSTSYQLINDLLCDIKRPFNNICIHGYHPHQLIQYLSQHYQLNTNNNTKNIQSTLQQSTKQQQKPKLTIIDYLDLIDTPSSIISQSNNNNFQLSIKKVQNSDSFIAQQEQFDLIISSLELNHCNNQQKLLQKYLRTLKPDGALIGCAMVQGTLSQLHWSYMMAQNQRHGGLSPKVLQFPSLGQLGNLLTQSHYHLATVLNRDYHLQLQSPLQVIKLIQLLGENMYLKGRRKGVYKQLLISMYAMYQSQFQFSGQLVAQMLKKQQKQQYQSSNVGNINTNKININNLYINNVNKSSVLATLVLSPFVGWKYSPNQPKPLRRGQHGDSIDFVDQLRKYDPDLQHFVINQDSDQPQPVKSKQKQQQTIKQPIQPTVSSEYTTQGNSNNRQRK